MLDKYLVSKQFKCARSQWSIISFIRNVDKIAEINWSVKVTDYIKQNNLSPDHSRKHITVVYNCIKATQEIRNSKLVQSAYEH